MKESGNEMPESPVCPSPSLALPISKLRKNNVSKQDLNKFGGLGGFFMVSRSVHIGNNGI